MKLTDLKTTACAHLNEHLFKEPEKKNKYNARKVTIDGLTFDSKKEAARYLELRMLERAGLIKNLRHHVVYELIPANGKERAVKYEADFVYEQDGQTVVNDVKSEITRKLQPYIIKRKLMLEKYGIEIKET